MPTSLFRAAALAVVLTVPALTPALAQQAYRLRGTIERVGDADITVKSSSGDVVVRLPDPPRVSAVVKATLADIKANTFVGAVGMPGPDGTLRAAAITILPDAARANSFHSAWDSAPESTMTNATVTETVKRVDGETLTLTYKDGSKTLLTSPETAIVAIAPGSKADLKPGLRTVVFAAKGADGTVTGNNIIVGRDGAEPPM